MFTQTPQAQIRTQSDRDRACCEIAEKEARRRTSGVELSETELAEQQALLDVLGMTLDEAVAEGERLWNQANDQGGS